MKRNTLLLGFLACTSMLFAQVGVNTTTPTATLEVVGKGATTTIPDGIIAPRISKQQLAAKTAGTYGSPQTAAVVFVNDITTPTGTIPSLAQVVEVTALGYYYFNGTIWKAIGGTPTADTSIYLNDGTLAGNRIVTQGASTLAFNATSANAFSVDGTSLSVDAANHRAGFGTASPAATVDVVGKAATTTVPDGIVAPRISKQQLAAKTAGTYGAPQTAAIVFVNDVTAPTGTTPSLAQVAAVTTIGYYYFNGTAWNPIGGTPTVDTSIYAGDGTLAGNRIVTQGASTLAFNATAVNAFSVDGTSLSVDATNHRVGVGTAAPQRPLHVNANTGPVRFESLATLAAGTSASGLVIDGNGDIYKNNSVSVEGQILRIGLNVATYTTLAGEVGLRFSSNDSAGEMANAPNGAPNFINTIVGATIADGVSATAGTGSVARTTDQITLQPGVYKLQVRLVGNFATASSSNTVFLKAIVNNNEYSLVNTANNNALTSLYYFDDYINITGSAQTVDFSISPAGNNFTVASSSSPGTGNSYRSLILIQRLR